MSDDATLPATKGDLSKVQQDLVDLESRMASKRDLVGVKQELRREIKAMGQELRMEMRTMSNDIKRYFDLAVETIRHDLLGANKDDIEVMKDRITRLEKHTGLVTQ